MISVRINGVDRTASVAIDSISMSWNANLKGEASFSAYDSVPATFRPVVGHPIEIYDGSTRIYYGMIHEFSERKTPGSSRLVYDIVCQDYSSSFDHHLVAQVYDDQTLKFIVEDIIANYASGHGITTAGVQAGPTIKKAIFNYVSVSQAFSELSEITGYAWWVDENKDLKFAARESISSPFVLDQFNVRPNVTIRKTLSNYRNIQYIRAGNDITSIQSENFKGDGTRKVFNLAFPVATVPDVRVDSVLKTIGIRGVETGKDWYWNKGSTEISQDSSGTSLTTSNTLNIQYKGLFPIIVIAENSAAISERVGIESTSGHYEAIETAEHIETTDLALDKANGLLRRHSIVPMTIRFDTRQDGLRGGQLLRIILSEHGIDGDYLIDRVTASYESRGSSDGFMYSCTALNGDGVNGWVEFFKKMAASGKTYVIRENEVLVKLMSSQETISFTDTMTSSQAAYSCAITDLSEVGYAETC